MTLPTYRQFPQKQVKTLKEYEDCVTSLDKTSQFAQRQPKLPFITNIELHYRQFSFEKMKPSEIPCALQQP